MSPGADGTGGLEMSIEEPEVGRTRRRWSVGRVILNLFVVVAFGAAVFALYTLIQGSGVLGGDREPATTPASFEDVPADYAESDRIHEAVDTGLVTPASSLRFGPSDAVTRGEFAGVVVRTMGWDVGPDETHTFADVTGDPDVVDEADYIAVVATKGVMGGAGGVPPTFSPSDPVQVRHLLVVLARAAGTALPEPTTPDRRIEALPVSDEIRSAYQRLSAAGILDGVDLDSADTTLVSAADREQVAVMAVNLHRLLRGE